MIDPELALQIIAEDPDAIAFDTETNGLAVTSVAVGWVITNSNDSIYVPVRHEGGGNIPDAEGFERQLAAAFAERNRLGFRTVGHNIGFDLRVAGRHGVYPNSPLEDTMLNESLINDLTVGYGLDNLSMRYGVTVKKGSELYVVLANRFGGIPDRKQMGNFWRMPGDHDVVVDYATGDGVSTLEVWAKQQYKLDELELRVPWQLECDLLPYVARMHHRGIKISPYWSEKLANGKPRIINDMDGEIAVASLKFSPGFNVRSPKEVEALYRANGYTDGMFDRTDSGKVSFTERWLETNEIGDAILGVRKLEKAKDSFITPLIDSHNINGRVHPTLNQSKSDDYGVSGARFSCSDPNLQAFPKRNKAVGKVVRKVVVPDDGFIVYEGDFSQQEPRMFTHYSEQPALVEGYRSGTMDMHDRAMEILKLERDPAKRLGMGMLTMMSIKTLAMHMRWDYATAKWAHNAFLSEAFPEIGQFQRDAVATFKARGYVKTLIGRRANYEGIPMFAYRAVSRIIQNNGGDHMKAALLVACRWEDQYPDVLQILLTIHDSIVFQCRVGWEWVARAMIDEIDQIASNPPFNMIVPIPMELAAGMDWAEASYGKKIKSVREGWIDGWGEQQKLRA